MKIVLKIPRLQSRPLGEQIYLRNVIKALLQQAPTEWEIIAQIAGLKGRSEHFEQFKLVDEHNRIRTQQIPLPDTLLEACIRKFNFPSAKLLFQDATIVHNFRCQWVPRNTPGLVMTIQDVIPFRWEENEHCAAQRQNISELINCVKAGVKAIITISEFSRSEIVKIFGIDPALIKVIVDGVDHQHFIPIADADHQRALKQLEQFGIKSPYLLFIGGQVPRKNLARLVQAFDRAKDSRKINHQLVIAGSSRLSDDVVEQVRQSKYKDEIIVPGYLSDADCLKLIQLANMLVFPSLYEGFGLPPLEAMACGVPVASSNAASLPEVCGDAALYFDPLSVEDMANSILRLASETGLRQSLIEKGLLQARKFSWENNARDTIELYKQIQE